jgi:HAE1 family hydrophobic/amphiphilic exporter-1
MQNPPAIRVGGQQSKSTYQYTLQDTDQDELQNRRHQADERAQPCARLSPTSPSDMDFNSPSVNVAI